MSEEQIIIRPARTEDHQEVLAFCDQAGKTGDYIPDVWDDWLHDDTGLLLVATIHNQPVGIVHMQMLNTTEAWLEGMRVDSAYRRRGVASTLDNYAIQEAQQRGATSVRLITETGNEPGIQFARSLHMHRVSSFTLYSAAPLTTPPGRSSPEQTRLATLDDLDAIIDYLNASNVFPLAGGLYYIAYTAYQITAAFLAEMITAHQVYLLWRWDRIDGLAITEHDGKRLATGYIDGMTIEAISLIAHDLRQRATTMELQHIYASVPDLLLILDGLNGMGYETDNTHFYVYERLI